MKKLLLLFVFFVFIFISSDAYSVEISRHMSGSWYNPMQSGHGLSVEVLSPERTIFYWYVYNPDGTPTFLVADGENRGDTIFATLYHHTGMRWGEFDPNDDEQMVWGEATLQFINCGAALFAYEATHSQQDIPFGEGQTELTKLVGIDHLPCAENRVVGIYQGITEPEEDEDPYAMTILLTPDMRLVSMGDEEHVSFGTYTVNGSQITVSDITTYSINPFDPYTLQMTGTGAVTPEYRMHLTFSSPDLQDDVEGDFLASDWLYRRGIDFSVNVGMHISRDMITGDSGFVDVFPNGGSNGAFRGSEDGGGCDYNGQMIVSDRAFNIFDVSLMVTNCGSRNGDYIGSGYQVDVEALDDRDGYLLITSDGQQPFVLGLASM